MPARRRVLSRLSAGAAGGARHPAPSCAQPAGGRRRADGAVLRLPDRGQRLGCADHRSRLVLRRVGVAAWRSLTDIGAAVVDRRRVDRQDDHRLRNREHVRLLRPTRTWRCHRFRCLPVVPRDGDASGRTVGRRLPPVAGHLRCESGGDAVDAGQLPATSGTSSPSGLIA